jgi:hypothetical protein
MGAGRVGIGRGFVTVAVASSLIFITPFYLLSTNP